MGVPTKQYYEAALAVVFMELYQTAPALHRPDVQTNEPTRGAELNAEACTTRERVDRIISEDGSYNGRHPEDIFISAPPLAEILGVSTETARRRLRFFEERGILFQGVEGSRLYYELASEYRPDVDESVPSESEIIDATKRIMNAVKED